MGSADWTGAAAGQRGARGARPRLAAVLTALVVVAALLAGCQGSGQEGSSGGETLAAAPTSGPTTDLAAAMAAELTSPTARQVRAVLVSVNGKPLVETYRNSSPTEARNAFSVTKSVISTLVGIAIADGLIRGTDQTLGELLPAEAAEMGAATRSVTLGQLLTMSAGFPGDGPDGPDPAVLGSNWVSGILATGNGRKAGDMYDFSYSSMTSHLLAAVLERATGGRLLDYARRKLFDPLGIRSRPAAEPVADASDANAIRQYTRAAFAWPTDPQRVHTGFSFLKLTPPDLMRLGQLYLDRGRWHGQQLVPASWVDTATRKHTAAGGGAFHGYGYQWWTTTVDGHLAFAAVGFGGQLIEVVPALRLVVVASTDVTDGTEPMDTGALASLVRDVVTPGLE